MAFPFLAVQMGRQVSVKMVQKLSTRYTSTVATLLAHVVTFAVETRKVAFKYTKMCFFLRTCVMKCMKETVEEGEGRELWWRCYGLCGSMEGIFLEGSLRPT